MILVTGTKRSGTSMWMQILKAAGLPLYGRAFPRDWAEVLRDANPEGFYESHLRGGIYYATNPHPHSGRFLAPHDTRNLVVKVFIGGVVKSDLAYVDRVLATMRPVREYVASLTRLYTLERRQREARGQRLPEGAVQAPDASALLWWDDNYSLLRDALTRRYPLHLVSYASVLREPERAVGEVLGWLGQGDVQPAVAAVRAALRTEDASARGGEAPTGESRAHEALFDELYARVDRRIGLDAAFIARLNEAHDVLAPRIAEARAAGRARLQPHAAPEPVDARRT